MGFFEQAALVCSSQTVQDHHETHCTIYAVKWIESSLEGLKKKLRKFVKSSNTCRRNGYGQNKIYKLPFKIVVCNIVVSRCVARL